MRKIWLSVCMFLNYFIINLAGQMETNKSEMITDGVVKWHKPQVLTYLSINPQLNSFILFSRQNIHFCGSRFSKDRRCFLTAIHIKAMRWCLIHLLQTKDILKPDLQAPCKSNISILILLEGHCVSLLDKVSFIFNVVNYSVDKACSHPFL